VRYQNNTRNKSQNPRRATLEGGRSSKGKVLRRKPFKSGKAFEGEKPTECMPSQRGSHFKDPQASKKGFQK